jgi:hypothetical protein
MSAAVRLAKSPPNLGASCLLAKIASAESETAARLRNEVSAQSRVPTILQHGFAGPAFHCPDWTRAPEGQLQRFGSDLIVPPTKMEPIPFGDDGPAVSSGAGAVPLVTPQHAIEDAER